MYKNIRNRFLRIVLIALTSFIGLLLLFYLFVYFACPSYSFREPKPFAGTYLYNPYQDMNPDHWKRYNFHCHSRKYLGITDGRHSTENDIDSMYQRMGYDHYGISDYMSINRHRCDQPDYIPGYEHGYGLIRKTHQLCIGAEKVWHIDYPFVQNLSTKQNMLNQLGKRGRFAVPAHASFTMGYKVRDMKYLSNYRLLEVINPFGFSFEHWDMALSNGHRVYIVGDDDTHNVLNPNEIGKCFTMINTADMTPEQVYSALENGNAYGVNFYIYYNEPFEVKVENILQLPHLTRCELVGDTLFVETSDVIEKAEFIGQGGRVLATQENVRQAYYVIQPEDQYVRTNLQLPKQTFFYLNPVTRHPDPVPVDERLDSINWFRTGFLWLVYAFMVFVIIRAIVRKLNTKKTHAASE